jgi:hypothetical protein
MNITQNGGFISIGKPLPEDLTRKGCSNAQQLGLKSEEELAWLCKALEENTEKARIACEHKSMPTGNIPIYGSNAIYQPFYKIIRNYILQNNCMINNNDYQQLQNIQDMITMQTQCTYFPSGWVPTYPASTLKHLLSAYENYYSQMQHYFIETIRADILERNGMISYNDTDKNEIKKKFAQSTISKYFSNGWILIDQELDYLFSTLAFDTNPDPTAINTPQQFSTHPKTDSSACLNPLNGPLNPGNMTAFDGSGFAPLGSTSQTNNSNHLASVAPPQHNFLLHHLPPSKTAAFLDTSAPSHLDNCFNRPSAKGG